MHTYVRIQLERIGAHMGLGAFWRRPFFRHVAVVASGNMVAQAIAVLFSPIIARLYGPEAFGILGVFTSLTALLIPLGSLGYAYAIVLPTRDEAAQRLLVLVGLLAFTVGLVVAGVLVPFRLPLSRALGVDGLAPYMLWVPLAVFFGTLGVALDQWLVRKQQFRASAGITVYDRLALNGAKTILGFFVPGPGVLISITALGNGFHALLAGLRVRTTLGSRPEKARDWMALVDKEMVQVARHYADFPIYRLPQILLNSATHGMPVVLMASFFGPVPAGLYTMGERVIRLPGAIISTAVNKVFQQRLAQAAHEGESLKPLIRRTTLGLAAAGALPFGLLMALGPMVFSLVFGPEWRPAGEYVRWLGLFVFCGFINGPSVTAIPILSLQGQLLVYEIASATGKIIAMLVGALLMQSDIAAIALFSVTGAVAYLALIAYVYLQSDKGVRVLDSQGPESGMEGDHDV